MATRTEVGMYVNLGTPGRRASEDWDGSSRGGPPRGPPVDPTGKEMVELTRLLAASAGAAAASADDDDAPPPASPPPAPASKAKWGGTSSRPGVGHRRAATAASAVNDEPPPSDNNLDEDSGDALAAEAIGALSAHASA